MTKEADAGKRVRLERVQQYSLEAHRDELRRVLAKITGRKVTGTIELHLNQGTPGAMTSREAVKETE